MSCWSKASFGLSAAFLMLGAVHLEIASGSDLKAFTRGDASLFGSRGVRTDQSTVVDVVNREAKADRLAAATRGLSGPTLVFKVAGMKNTSVATFLLAPQRPAPATGSGAASRAIMKTAACEPPVSALTEAAQLMKTGRCVT